MFRLFLGFICRQKYFNTPQKGTLRPENGPGINGTQHTHSGYAFMLRIATPKFGGGNEPGNCQTSEWVERWKAIKHIYIQIHAR